MAMKKVELSSERLLLRGANDGDAQGLYEAFSDPEVMRYWSSLPHAELARTEEWVERMKVADASGFTDFIMCLRPEMVPIGKIGVWQGDEIGFMLKRSCWGKGIAQEAMNLILPYLFLELGFEQIMADTDPRNDASIGLLQKLGFVVYDYQERTMEIGGQWVDSKYLKLTREEWGKRR